MKIAKNSLILGMLLSLFPFVSAEPHIWDSLRPLASFAGEINAPVKFAVFLLASAVFVVSLLAYQKSKSKRMLIVSAAFFFFALKWLVKLVDHFVSPGSFLADSSENVFELIILVSLFTALFYKPDKSKGKK